MMNQNKEYIDPLEYDIEEARKRLNMSKKNNELEKYMEMYKQALEDLNDYKNLYIRQRSEMENYAKYKEREIENIRKNAGSEIIKNLLPVLDTLDAGMIHDPKLEPVRSQIIKILSSYGLKEIAGKGEKFDPNLEEAIGVSDQGEDGKVLEVVQKGYMLNGEVLRTAKVIVSKR